MNRAVALVLALVTVACADRTALLVEVSSPDLAIPADIDSLTIRAHTPTGAMFDQTFDVNMGWPHSITILPADMGDQGQIFVEVTGNHGGDAIVRRVALTAFQPGITRRVDIVLQRSCLHVACGDDVDCVAGSCVGAVGDAGVDASSADAGTLPDSGVDAASFDAGMDDVGTMDGGGVDASGVDASGIDASGVDASGVDASGVDAGRDAGTDAGRDAGTDAGMPVDAGSGCTGIACRGVVVISEMTTTGPGGGLDEFVELYNRGSGTASLGGCSIAYHSASGGTRTVRVMLAAGTTIPSHRYYLAAGSGYAGAVTPDTPPADRWTTGASDTGGTITLECGGSTMIVDRIGYGTGTLAEGTAISTPAVPAGGSYERKAQVGSTATSMSAGGSDASAGNGEDTDVNSADFIVRPVRDPQSSTSPAEP